MQHFAAFTNLGEVGGDLKIQNNINLELAKATIGSIFPSLTAIAGDLLIENNKQLNQLSGFGQLGTVGSLNIARNSKLSAIKAGTFASLQVRVHAQRWTQLCSNARSMHRSVSAAACVPAHHCFLTFDQPRRQH